MKNLTHTTRLGARLFSAVLIIFASLAAHATPATTQSIVLKPGWNAVAIRVLPANTDLNSVFSGVAIDSLWAYENNLISPDFIQEVSEQTLAKSGWVSWVPTNRVDAFQNDLSDIQVNRSYLIKFAGTNTVTLTLTGRPSLRTPKWTPNAYNFLGFPVDPALPPTFLNFFKPSAAHYTASTGLQPIYRLNASGAWQRVAPSDQMAAGEALWVFCKGASEYLAPLKAFVLPGDGLTFIAATEDVELELSNLAASSANVTFRDLGAPASNPLSYQSREVATLLAWTPLPEPYVSPLAAGASYTHHFGLRRVDMAADLFETVLEITDGSGTRLLLPVSAERPTSPVLSASATTSSSTRTQKKGASRQSSLAEVVSHAGLWMGSATLNAVSEAHSGGLTTNLVQGFTLSVETNSVTQVVTTNYIPNSVTRTNVSMTTTPTGTDFNLRLLLHVDSTGQTRLLKEVIQMWKDAITSNDASGVTVTTEPGRVVLLTDDSLVGQFGGVATRDGTAVGHRISTAGFDFPENELPMAGDFVLGSSVIGTNSILDSFARNPFKHKYHPDHTTGFNIQRVIELQLLPPATNAPPGYGSSVLDGVYRETVSGLHRTNITVSGTFHLNRIATAAVLNQ